MKGRDRGDVIGPNYVVGVLLYADVLPNVLKIRFQFRILLHVFYPLNGKRRSAFLIRSLFPGTVIGQTDNR